MQETKILSFSKISHWVFIIQDISNIKVCKRVSGIKLKHINTFLKYKAKKKPNKRKNMSFYKVPIKFLWVLGWMT